MELSYRLAQAVEKMVITDVAATSRIQVRAFSTSLLETLRKSVTLCEVNGGVSVAAIVLHPLDFEAIELALLTTPAVEHMSLPFDATARRLWGIPVTTTVAAAAGTGWVLGAGAVTINTDSAGVQVTWSETSNADDWSRNFIRARCEGRYATSVYQPLSVVKSTLTGS